MNVERVIVHHSGGPDGEGNTTAAIRKWHMGTPPNGPVGGPYVDVGYHLLIENIGGSYEAVMGRPWDMNGAHTIGQNDSALGICIVGNWNLEPPPDGQLLVAARFVAMWLRLFDIPDTALFRHSYFADTDCPGHAFDLERFRMMVKDY